MSRESQIVNILRSNNKKEAAKVEEIYFLLKNLFPLSLNFGDAEVRGYDDLTNQEVKILSAALKQISGPISLDFHQNRLTDEGTEFLGEIPGLVSLNLSYNLITNEGLNALLSNSSLDDLNLGGNKITNKGAKLLAESSRLVIVNIIHSKITDEGMAYFLQNKRMLSLNFGYRNLVSDKCTESVNKHLKGNLNSCVNNIIEAIDLLTRHKTSRSSCKDSKESCEEQEKISLYDLPLNHSHLKVLRDNSPLWRVIGLELQKQNYKVTEVKKALHEYHSCFFHWINALSKEPMLFHWGENNYPDINQLIASYCDFDHIDLRKPSTAVTPFNFLALGKGKDQGNQTNSCVCL